MKRNQHKNQEYFAFTTSSQPVEILERLPGELQSYAQEKRLRDGLLYDVTEDGFRIGIGRAGHSDGYWYRAVMERENGVTHIRGKIVLGSEMTSDHADQPMSKWKKIREWAGIVFMLILLAIPIMIFFLVLGVRALIRKLRGLPRTLTMEETLVDFMTSRMGCAEIDFPSNAPTYRPLGGNR